MVLEKPENLWSDLVSDNFLFRGERNFVFSEARVPENTLLSFLPVKILTRILLDYGYFCLQQQQQQRRRRQQEKKKKENFKL